MNRGQVPLTVVEATVGILLLTSVTFAFVLGVPQADPAETQLDAYASDATTILATEQPRHAGQTRLDELLASKAAFEREKESLRRRVERILPANLMFRVETEYGTVGHPRPEGVPTGTATVTTTGGDLTLQVWYA